MEDLLQASAVALVLRTLHKIVGATGSSNGLPPFQGGAGGTFEFKGFELPPSSPPSSWCW